ncbi:MAG: alpha/beta hydrolase [Candidatus Delongbacteria bacterium]|nr:alpha/beta hydrolase [Candidatus Delongbacteria bacterium]MBN2834472.1 alpha/beta hydrolase [Candidatus Delongbacteria bacterium]
MTQERTFQINNDIDVQKVQYHNRYGIVISAELYTLKKIDKTKKHSGIVIGTPYGGVKEQGAGIYAQEMASRGFVTIVFDESYNGESGGEPRHTSSPDIFVEDFCAGVDFLGSLNYVDRDKIGAIGICGSGAFALTAAQVDHRIKAVATASMYDMSRLTRNGWQDSMSDTDRIKILDGLAKQRWKDVDNGEPEYNPSFPGEPSESIPEGLDPISSEFFEYYGMKRGFHPRARANFTTTSNLAFMNFSLVSHVKSISPRPVLFIMGENAHSRYFTEDIYKEANEPKELYIVPNARHIDLYDRLDMIPFDKLNSFFKRYLE